MNVLELFSGSESFSKVARGRGYKTFTSDINDFGTTDYITDIRNFDVDCVPFIPDLIWCSIPCTYFSVASIGKHWNKDHTPKTDNARLGIEIVKQTMAVINHFQGLNGNLIYIIENPRGKLRKLGLIPTHFMKTVTYCQYGDFRMKPTDLFTNLFSWIPRPMCKNGDDCHVSAPRGSATGTQGIKGSYERSKVPYELCSEIFECALMRYNLFNPKQRSINRYELS